jgi:MFS family permease
MAAGFVVGMYSLTNTFGNVLAGRFTDRYGAAAVMKAGLLLTSAALLLYNLVDEVQTLLIVRFVHGMLGGLIVPAAFTYMANMTNRERQGSQSAVMGSFVGIAAVIGPAYSGIMAERSSVPFVFTTIAALGLILFVFAAMVLRRRVVSNTGRSKRPIQKLVLNGGIIRAFLGAFFLMFSQGALAYLLPQQVESLGYNPRLSGTLMSMFGIVAVALFTLPTNKWFDRIPPARSAATGLGLMGISQILISQSEQASVLYAVLTLYGIGFALLFPSINALLAHSTLPENRGQVYGIFYALFSVGTVAGSSGLGLLPVALKVQFLATGGALMLCAIVVLLTPMKQALVSKDA